MAERNYTTRFGSDTSGFKKGVSELVQQLDKYNKALVDNQYQIKATNKEISTLEKEQSKLKEKVKDGSATDDEKAKYQKLTEEIEKHRITLAQLRTDQTNIKNSISETSAKLKETSESVQSADEKFSAWKVTLGNLAADGIKKIISGCTDLAKSVIETGEQFSSSMSEVQAISGASAEEIKQLEETARKYGSTTVFSASEAAQALKYMSLAGWNANQSISALGGVLDLAAASGMELSYASDMVTDYLSAFGMQASDSSYMADLLAYAQSHANTSAQQLGEAYGNCAANLNAAGQDIETVTSFLEAMANQGLKGSEAGTALAAMMREIGDAMQNGSISINDTNIAVMDSQGNYRDLTNIIQDVNNAVCGLGTAEKTAALSSVFTSRSLKGLNLVLNEGIDSVAGYEEELRKSGGTASEAASIMSDNLSGDLKSMNSAFDELKLKIYDSAETPLRKLIQTVTSEGVPALEALINNFDKVAPVIVTATSALLGYKAAIGIQSLINNVSAAYVSLKASITGATAAQTGLNTAMKANPVMLVITAVASLTLGLGAYIAASNSAAESTDDTTKAIERAKSAAEDYDRAMDSAQDSYSETISKAGSEAAVIEALGKRYEELRQKTNLTATEKSGLNIVISQLSEHMNLETKDIYDQDGALKSLNGKIKEVTKSLKDQAQIKASEELYTEAVKTRIKATVEGQKAKDEADKYYIEHKEIIDKYTNGEAWGGRLGEIPKEYTEYDNLLDSVLDLSKRVQEATKLEEEYCKQMSKTTESISESEKSISNAADTNYDYVKTIKDISDNTDSATKSVEELKAQLTSQNKALLDNQEAIRNVKAEQKELEKFAKNSDSEEYTARLNIVKNKISELKTQQTEIRDSIKAIKEEIADFEDNVTNSLDKVQDSYTQWQNVIKEVSSETNSSGTISIKTLNSIQKKYPELIDIVNEYIAGIKNENDVISALEEVYNDDIKNYKNAVQAKALASESFYQNLLDNNAKFVNDYKDKYGIDLKNYKTAEEAKVAIQAQAEAQKRNEITKTVRQTADIYINSGSSELTRVGQEMKKSIDDDTYNSYEIWKAGQNAVNSFSNGLNQYYNNFFSTYSDSAIKDLLDSSNSSGNSSGSNSKKWTTSNGDGIVGTGSTRSESHLDWIDKEKALGRLSTENEIRELRRINQYRENSADDRYKIELKLYQAEQTLAEEREKAEKERFDRQKEKYSLASEAYNKLINDKIDALNKEKEAAKDAADKEIAAIDRQIEARKRLNEDTDRKSELQKINAQLAYDSQLDSLSRRELERKRQDLLNEQAEVDWQRKMLNKKSSITDSLNASNAKTNKAMEALRSAADSAKNYFDKLSKNQSNTQIVNNNSDTRNIQIIQNALSDQQMYNKIMKAIYSK